MATSTCGNMVSQSSSERASGKTATYIFSYYGGRGSRGSGEGGRVGSESRRRSGGNYLMAANPD